METLSVGWIVVGGAALDQLALTAALLGVLALMTANAAATLRVYAGQGPAPRKLVWLAAIWGAPFIGLLCWMACRFSLGPCEAIKKLRSTAFGSRSPGRS